MNTHADARQTLAIVGFGDLGERVAGLLPVDLWHCLGLRRQAAKVPATVTGVAIDLAQPDSLQVLADHKPDAMLVALTPTERTELGYQLGFAQAMRSIVNGLNGHQPNVAYFVSSTRVYAESAGGWVDEDSDLATNAPYAEHIIAAEQHFLAGLKNAVVLRAGGLYGQAPGPLVQRVREGRFTPKAPVRFANRIHRDDVAAFVAAHLDRKPAAQILNLIDNAPVPIQETEAWLCEQLNIHYEPPPGDQSSIATGKRISNARLRETGFEFRYPDYRSGYALDPT